jgi:hypothetical protein
MLIECKSWPRLNDKNIPELSVENLNLSIIRAFHHSISNKNLITNIAIFYVNHIKLDEFSKNC